MPVYLTKRNHQGPHLLRTIRSTTKQLPSTELESHSPQEVRMTLQTDAEIFALPESSDEEKGSIKSSGDEEISVSTKRKRDEEASFNVKRTKSSSRPTRSSQRKPQDVQPEKPQESSFSLPGADDWFNSEPSQSSSQRKTKAGYGKSNSYRPTPRSSQDGASRLVVPDDIPDVGGRDSRKSRAKAFTTVQDSPKSTKSSPRRILKPPPPDVNEIPKSIAKFSIPDDLLLEPSPSTNSLDTEIPRIFDSNYSPEASAKTRRGSTSSLSSVDSIASALLSQSQKDDLKNGIDTSTNIPRGYVQCPLCSELVLKSLDDRTNPSKLSLRAQQAYCHTHKVKDAHTAWQSRQYPLIDWTALEKKRIPRHLPHLTKTLLRKQPSFYFSSLESNFSAAKGNRRKINAYLLDGIMGVAKPGYYGAKGAKIMGHAIATSFAKQLKMALMQDKTIATAGISGFTSAVLLPELCQRLVMEDMGIGDEEEARRVLSESSEVGLLLYPDDDHVELVEAD